MFTSQRLFDRYPHNSYYMLRGPDVQAGGMATGLILVTTTLACTLPSFQVPRLWGVVDGVRTQTREPSGQAGERVLPLVASASELTTAPTLHVEYNTTLLPSVNTIARGMCCGAKYTHHTFTPTIKH